MEDAKDIIRRRIDKARSDRAFHRLSKGGARMAMTEAGIAPLKIAWLADLYREITGEVLMRGDLENR